MSDPRPSFWRRPAVAFAAVAGVVAVLVFLVTGLLTSIFQRKQEARNPYVRLVRGAGGEEPGGAARRGRRGDDRSGGMGRELVERVRRLSADRRGDTHAVRRIRG